MGDRRGTRTSSMTNVSMGKVGGDSLPPGAKNKLLNENLKLSLSIKNLIKENINFNVPKPLFSVLFINIKLLFIC